MIEIGAIEGRELHQSVVVVERQPAVLVRAQPHLAQFAEHTVDVHGAQSQSVGEHVLGERAGIACAVRKSREPQTCAQLQKGLVALLTLRRSDRIS